MDGINSVNLVGNVAQDGRLKYIGTNGNAVLEFSVAIGSRKPIQGSRDPDNGKVEYTDHVEFVQIKVWGKRAEFLAQYVVRGVPIAINGAISTRRWVDKNQQTRFSTFVNAEVVRTMPRNPGTAHQYRDRDMPAGQLPSGDSAPEGNDTPSHEPGEDDTPW
jgi:single-strand DNA-binding protein